MKLVVKSFIKLVGLFAIFFLAYFLFNLVQENGAVRETISNFGYFGVLIVSLISGFNLLVPIPTVSFVPAFIESGLDIWIVIFFIVIGTSFADSIAYVIGRVGREFTKSMNEKILFRRLTKMKEKYYWSPVIVLFLFATFVPLPNELLLIPLGFMGYKLKHLILPYIAGNTIFTTLTSFGAINIFSIF